MGIYRLETYLEKGVPNDYCMRVSIQELGHQYKQDTGKTPVIIVDGAYSLRTIYSDIRREWFLGGQLKEFIEAMKKFVGAFKDIGVDVMFFFDGASQEEKRDTWRERRESQIKDVEILLSQLKDRKCPNVGELPHVVNGRVFLLPPLIGAIGRFIAKYVLQCQVRVSSSECDAEIAEYAWQHGIFGILSRDTDFVLLRGARHYFSIERLDMNDMTTVTYDKEGLKKSLSLDEHELLMLATLLGNDIIPFYKIQQFHKRLCPRKSKNIFILLPIIVQYIKDKKIPNNCNFKYLQDMAKEIFSDENMAEDLRKSVQSYLPLEAEEQIETSEIKYEDENWQKILTLLQQKHLSCCLTPHLYPVTLGEAYELGVAIEDFRNHGRKRVARIYLPLRERIYGILLKEKKGISCVKEWCVEQYNCPKEPYNASLHFIDNIENLHPGLLKLWSNNCCDTIRWRLFAESLTQNKKIDVIKLQKLGFPYAVPVAVLYYLTQEEKLLTETKIAAILAHAALVAEYDADKLRHIQGYRTYNIEAIILATVFHRGITTMLYLLGACGFDLEQAMPWHYFDGRLFHKKYVDASNGMRDFQLCEDKDTTYNLYLKMKNLVTPPRSWRK